MNRRETKNWEGDSCTQSANDWMDKCLRDLLWSLIGRHCWKKRREGNEVKSLARLERRHRWWSNSEDNAGQSCDLFRFLTIDFAFHGQLKCPCHHDNCKPFSFTFEIGENNCQHTKSCRTVDQRRADWLLMCRSEVRQLIDIWFDQCVYVNMPLDSDSSLIARLLDRIDWLDESKEEIILSSSKCFATIDRERERERGRNNAFHDDDDDLLSCRCPNILELSFVSACR